MINIIHVNVHCDDQRKVTALEIKLKSIPEEKVNEGAQHLVARVSAAFYALPLFSDVGKTLKTTLNPNRPNVVDLVVNIRESELSFADVAGFIDMFQKELDESPF